MTLSVFPKPSPGNSPLTQAEVNIAQRPTHALIEVSDVGDGPGDFDADLTIKARHLVPLTSTVYNASGEPAVLRYAADFLGSLPGIVRDRIALGTHVADRNGRLLPEDIAQAQRDWREKTLRCVLNYAPRNGKKAEGGNGTDFYLVFVDGVEIYATPAIALQYLKVRDRIDALFRVPTRGHPLFREGEQFRSAVVGKTAHEAPEHLALVWRRGEDRRKLDALIPDLLQDEVAFVDSPYGNRRIITPDLARAQAAIDRSKDDEGAIHVQLGRSIVRVFVAKCLADVPEGEWGLWFNPADIADGSRAGYYEVSRRWEVGRDWRDQGQFPNFYLAKQDRNVGTQVNLLPKGSRRRLSDFIRGRIASFRSAA